MDFEVLWRKAADDYDEMIKDLDGTLVKLQSYAAITGQRELLPDVERIVITIQSPLLRKMARCRERADDAAKAKAIGG